MDTSTVPKTFWHALSFCMVVATLGLISIAYRASSVSIEIADAKINLSSALTTVKDIKGELERENERLKKANEELQAKVASLDKAKNGEGPVAGLSPSAAMSFKKLIEPAKTLDKKSFEQLDQKIQKVERYVAPQAQQAR